MKKSVLLLLAIFSFNTLLFAGSGGPDAFGYVWRDNLDPQGPVFNWIDLTAKPNHLLVENLSDDNTHGPFNLNFDFHYYWYDVHEFWVGSNGYICFQNGQLSAPFPAIPSVAQPQDIIAPMASDLMFGGTGNPGQCMYWQNPTGDSLIVSWIDVPFWDPALPNFQGQNSFQIILSKPDSSITFQYLAQSGVYNGGTTIYLSAGIENISGGVGLQTMLNPVSTGTSYFTTPYAVKFYYPASTTYQALDASVAYNNNETNSGRFISNSTPAPWVMSSRVKNTGNVNLNPFNVYSYVARSNAGAAGQIMASDTVTSPGLAPQATSDVVMSNTFSPSLPGTYIQVTRTLYPGDIVPTNDSATMELVSVDTTSGPVVLTFDGGSAQGVGINWQGGTGGTGMYFQPPFYPCKITRVHAYIQANPNLVGFYMEVFDDNGAFGSAGTRLDSIYVPSSQFTAPIWVDVTLNQPIIINSGGFYVSWNMDGDGVTLGQDLTGPFSNNTFEVLSGNWAIYRSRETEDLLINATIDTVNLPLTVPGLKAESRVGNFYPNPAGNIVSIHIDGTGLSGGNLKIELYSTDGRLAARTRLILEGYSGADISLPVESLPAGLYSARILLKDQQYFRKLQVIR